ncbi:unnamed protein product [Brassica rapa]|nr:unnamed protein product [Brassica rapa]VDC58256.1 unnamed protein product [Brassica rapa]
MAAQASGLFSSAVTTAATSGVKKLHLFTTSHRPRSLSFPKTAIRAEKADSAAAAPAAAVKEEAPVGFTPPQLDPNTPSPIFAGSTGGLLRKAQVEEFYVITWNSPKEQIFEMPTGGAAIMREGPNLLKLARKEQCLALGTRLRSKYKINYQFYRVFPNGEVQYLHPKDGVYPEKANAGREGVGQNMRSIGKNVSPIEVKFTGKQSYDLYLTYFLDFARKSRNGFLINKSDHTQEDAYLGIQAALEWIEAKEDLKLDNSDIQATSYLETDTKFSSFTLNN